MEELTVEESKPIETTSSAEKAKEEEEEVEPREILIKFADSTPGELACVHTFEKPSKSELSEFCDSMQRKAIESLKCTPRKSMLRQPKQFPMFDYDGSPQIYEYFIQSPVIQAPKRKPYRGTKKRRVKKAKTEDGDSVEKIAPTRKAPNKAKEKKNPPPTGRNISTRSRASTEPTQTSNGEDDVSTSQDNSSTTDQQIFESNKAKN